METNLLFFRFQTILERREERVSRHLTSMKNEIAQLNHKVEMDKKKASSSNQKSRGSMPHSYQGVPMRVLKNQSDKVIFLHFLAKMLYKLKLFLYLCFEK